MSMLNCKICKKKNSAQYSCNECDGLVCGDCFFAFESHEYCADTWICITCLNKEIDCKESTKYQYTCCECKSVSCRKCIFEFYEKDYHTHVWICINCIKKHLMEKGYTITKTKE